MHVFDERAAVSYARMSMIAEFSPSSAPRLIHALPAIIDVHCERFFGGVVNLDVRAERLGWEV